ncbi:MAG: ATP-dependent DNA helicase [Anaeroplasmataceae bacterium]|nr:ATP-dependent DNA helicase [Anaeroplasmataceae bacterium]
MNKLDLLKKYYGYDDFKYPQETIIDSVLNGNDTIALLPTGFGKSVTFQIPALLLDGLTIVISPLIALMEDQVKHLKEKNILAEYLNSLLPVSKQKEIYSKLENLKLLYVSPERLLNLFFIDQIKKVNVSLIAVDEAHTILWAEGFRDAFAHIYKFINLFPKRPVLLALTATATNQTVEKIKDYLKLKNAFLISYGMDRPNIYYRVVKVKDKIKFIVDFILKNSFQKGVIYCLTRAKVEELSKRLLRLGIKNTYYHGGLDTDLKILNSELFSSGTIPLMICTNAYGMGIDIPDIRFVIHFQLPNSLEDLAQQMGRAARDGKNAVGIVLFSFDDLKINRYFIESANVSKKIQKEQYQKLNQVVDYCLTKKCRHQFLADYFNQHIDICKKNCDNCIKKE